MIYLDNAATSFPKPPPVLSAMRDCCARYCGNPGRGSHILALRSAETVYACREALAELFGSEHPENVVFTLNATMALNLAIKGLAGAGDHILFSDLEHNAVRRPIAALAAEKRITYSVFPSLAGRADRTDEAILAGIRKALRPNTRILVCTHASNICPVTMPLEAIGALCREKGIRFIVDARSRQDICRSTWSAWGLTFSARPDTKVCSAGRVADFSFCGTASVCGR